MKYGNHKVHTKDGDFDSKKEYNRWCELKLLERAGKITDLTRQVRFELIPTQRDSKGKVIEKSTSYVADFVYWDVDANRQVVEDTKGYRTKEYKLKRKMMLYLKGIRIIEM